MDIMVFRALRTKMLDRQAPAIRDSINHRIVYVLDVLDTE